MSHRSSDLMEAILTAARSALFYRTLAAYLAALAVIIAIYGGFA